MKFSVQTFVMCFLASLFVKAGGMSTGGGAAVVCRDANRAILSAELLDTFEGRVRFGDTINDLSQSPRDQILKAVQRLKNSKEQGLLRDNLAEMVQRLSFLENGFGLKLTEDLGSTYGVIIRDGCTLEGLGFYEADGTLKVATHVYRKLSETDKAAFVMHEAVYYTARKFSGHWNSEASRRLVALLFSENPNQSTLDVQIERILGNVAQKVAFTDYPDGFPRINFSPLSATNEVVEYTAVMQCLDTYQSPPNYFALIRVSGLQQGTLPFKYCQELYIHLDQVHFPDNGPRQQYYCHEKCEMNVSSGHADNPGYSQTFQPYEQTQSDDPTRKFRIGFDRLDLVMVYGREIANVPNP